MAMVGDAAGRLGLGLRHGERRFTLRAMLEQDPGPTLTWLAGHASCWANLHRRHVAVRADPGAWWSGRAARVARALEDIAATTQGLIRRESLGHERQRQPARLSYNRYL